MIKKLLALIFALLLFAPISVEAQIVPERDLVGDTLYIEPDNNIIKESLEDELDEDFEYPLKELVMTKGKYALMVLLPFLALLTAGLIPYIAEPVIKTISSKKQAK